MVNIPSKLMDQNIPFSFRNNICVPDNYKIRLAKLLFPSIEQNLVRKLARMAFESQDQAFAVKVLEKFGKKHAKALEVLDRKTHADHAYQLEKNQKDFARWKRWGFSPDLFHKHYEFVRFLLDTPLGSQMKLFVHDQIITLVDDEPAILIEGEYKKFSFFKDQFHVDSFKGENVLVGADGFVYTYLENGKGLQQHHPYLCDKPIAVARLTDEMFNKTMEAAQKFYDKPVSTEEFPHILQIVSSEAEGINTHFTNTLLNAKHPWIRIILGKDMGEHKKGDVFDVGFGWAQKPLLPGINITGRFRCMDLWNYQSAKRRIVTNIPITAENVIQLNQLVMEHQRASTQLGHQLGFNLFRHNCTAFINAVGKVVPSVGLETRIELKDLVVKVSPEWLKSVGRFGIAGYRKVKGVLDELPAFIRVPARKIAEIVRRIIDFIVAIPVNVFTYLTGGALGEKNPGFDRNVEPQLLRTQLKDFYYYLPGVLQEWQKRQKSTVYFDKPTTLAVA